MSDVISLAERRRQESPPCGCHKHVMERLHDRIRAQLEEHPALLIPRTLLEDVLTDVVETDARLLGVAPPEWQVTR